MTAFPLVTYIQKSNHWNTKIALHSVHVRMTARTYEKNIPKAAPVASKKRTQASFRMRCHTYSISLSFVCCALGLVFHSNSTASPKSHIQHRNFFFLSRWIPSRQLRMPNYMLASQCAINLCAFLVYCLCYIATFCHSVNICIV